MVLSEFFNHRFLPCSNKSEWLEFMIFYFPLTFFSTAFFDGFTFCSTKPMLLFQIILLNWHVFLKFYFSSSHEIFLLVSNVFLLPIALLLLPLHRC